MDGRSSGFGRPRGSGPGITLDGVLSLRSVPWPPAVSPEERERLSGARSADAFRSYEIVRRDVSEMWRTLVRMKGDPGYSAAQTSTLEAFQAAIFAEPARTMEPDWENHPRTYRADGAHINDPTYSFFVAALDLLISRGARTGLALVSTARSGPNYARAVAALSAMFPTMRWRVFGRASEIVIEPTPDASGGAGGAGGTGGTGGTGGAGGAGGAGGSSWKSELASDWYSWASATVELSSPDPAGVDDVQAARNSCGGDPFFLLIDHRGETTHRPDGARSTLSFEDQEDLIGRVKTTQDALHGAAQSEAFGPPHSLIWERLPYVHVPSLGSTRGQRGPRAFICYSGSRRRAYWGEYGSSEAWLLPEGVRKERVDPADYEAVSSERWGQHSALFFNPTLARAFGEDVPGGHAEGFDGCANCAATLTLLGRYLDLGHVPLHNPARDGDLNEGTPAVKAMKLVSLVGLCLGRPTLVDHPRREVGATDPKPTIHGLVCDRPFAGGMQAVIREYGAPLKALEDAIAREARRGARGGRDGRRRRR